MFSFINNPFSMVVAIVLIVSVAGVLRAKWGLPSRHERRLGRADPLMQHDNAHPSAETLALREEVKALKERIIVLERIATDTHDAVRITQEIDALRDA